MAHLRSRVVLPLLMVIGALGCGEPPPGRTFYDRTIQPILTASCAGNTSGCHRADPQGPFQFAAGNFDVAITPDALTGASQSQSAGAAAVDLSN